MWVNCKTKTGFGVLAALSASLAMVDQSQCDVDDVDIRSPGYREVAATCTINSASTLNFGSVGVLSANTDQTSTIQVQCTNTTHYNIGLDAGTGRRRLCRYPQS